MVDFRVVIIVSGVYVCLPLWMCLQKRYISHENGVIPPGVQNDKGMLVKGEDYRKLPEYKGVARDIFLKKDQKCKRGS